jgi:hypothetical protein
MTTGLRLPELSGSPKLAAAGTHLANKTFFITQEFLRLNQKIELDAFFFGMLDLETARRHLNFRAPVTDGRVGWDSGEILQSDRNTRRVHRRIAAADHDNMFADIYRGVADGK